MVKGEHAYHIGVVTEYFKSTVHLQIVEHLTQVTKLGTDDDDDDRLLMLFPILSRHC